MPATISVAVSQAVQKAQGAGPAGTAAHGETEESELEAAVDEDVLVVNGARYRQHRGLWQHRSKCRPIKQPFTSIASVSGSRASNKN